ncbi:MAG: hypothetical protein WAO55_00200 [Candidatus Manganitrophaceae bacterium]
MLFDFVRAPVQTVIDVDHKRFKNYGVYYGERNPLTTEKEKCSLKDWEHPGEITHGMEPTFVFQRTN